MYEGGKNDSKGGKSDSKGFKGNYKGDGKNTKGNKEMKCFQCGKRATLRKSVEDAKCDLRAASRAIDRKIVRRYINLNSSQKKKAANGASWL